MKTSNKRDLNKRRCLFPCEMRAEEGSDGGLVIEGYAAVWDQVYETKWFKETVKRGAFRKTLMERDQVALWCHDNATPLGRKSRGTLELREDEHGLYMRAILDPQIQSHVSAYRHIKRGDVTGMSFGFDIIKESRDDGQTPVLYVIEEARLYEVSPETIPAYDGTEIHARCEMDADRAAEILQARQATTSKPEAPTTPLEPEASHSEAGAAARVVLTLRRNRRNRNYDEQTVARQAGGSR